MAGKKGGKMKKHKKAKKEKRISVWDRIIRW